MNQPEAVSKANQLLIDYLINSSLYYEFDANEISDHQFDTLARELEASFDIVDHRHKVLVNRDNLKAGSSGAYITMPTIVRSIAAERARKHAGSLTHGKTDQWITAYLVETMGQNKNT